MVAISIITNIIDSVKAMASGNLTQNKMQYLPDWYYDREHIDPKDYTYTELLNAYKSWIYVCSSKNSQTTASFALRLYVAKTSKTSKLLVKTKKLNPETKNFLYSKEMGHLDRYLSKAIEIEEVLEHPFLELMKNVNPFMNEFELKEMTDLHEELTGNNYWYIVSNGAGIPAEIWIVPPDKMTVIPSKKEFIKGYVYKVGTQEIHFEREEIIHFKFPSPTSAYYGMGCFAAIIHAYNINENMNRYESALFGNMAKPDGVLQTDQSLNDVEFERIKKGWNQKYGGVDKTGKTAILERGLTYKPITFTPRELSFLAGRKVTKEEIFNAFGLPLGLFDKEANRANAEQATYTYMKDTISPRHRRQEQKINEKLLPRYDEHLFCAYENCVPEDKEFKHKVMVESVNKTITVNEARQEEGKEDVEGGDTLYVDSRLVPLGTSPEAEGEKELEDVSRKIAEKVKEKLNVN